MCSPEQKNVHIKYIKGRNFLEHIFKLRHMSYLGEFDITFDLVDIDLNKKGTKKKCDILCLISRSRHA